MSKEILDAVRGLAAEKNISAEKLMEALKNLDPVAYIRFASVYRSFRDIESFRAELADLLAK